ncbi:MAG: DNA repair protein RecN [Gemella sp.]|nr:DNA repair protein RecN [Gemella sp.]
MLIQLNIKQFGIIEESTIEFKSGLTVLTGETGAGKSMILAAISQLSGQRTSTSYIRHGQDKAYVEGVFDYPKNEKLDNILSELEIEIDEDTIIIARHIYSSGKSVCRINGSVVNLSTLKKVSSYLLDIHEQHDNQLLLIEKNHLSLLDSYINLYDTSEYREYYSQYNRYQELKDKILNLEKNESEMLQKIDFMKYQLKELSEMNLILNEDEIIQEELDYLENFEKINSLSTQIYSILNKDGGLLEEIYNLADQLEKISRYASNFDEKSNEVRNMYYIFEDLKYDISKFNDNIDFDENRLDTLNLRLSKIKGLEKKYSRSVNDIIKYKSELEKELAELENLEENTEMYKLELEKLEDDLAIKADNVTNIRKLAAKKLETLIQDELKFLYMEKSSVKIDIQEKKYSKDGKDEIKILMSANLGEPLKSISKVASGGELSRIMLALKIIFSKSIDAISIIFDEIDTGVSGRVSQRMAEKMYQLAVDSQVLCISHLPQTTALADNNLYIQKNVKEDRTVSEVVELSDNEKIKEISRMISGDKSTKLAEEHAIEMIKLAEKTREDIKVK